MRIFLWILGILLLILFLLLFVKVRLIVKISESEKLIAVKLGFLKFKLFPSEKSAGKTDKDKENIKKNDKNIEQGIGNFKNLWYNNSRDIKKALLRLKKRLLIEDCYFEYRCGFSDAAKTAVLYGTVSGLYYNIFSFLDRHFKIKNMSAEINPDFNTNKKHIAVSMVLRLTIADIIYIFTAILPILKNL